MYDLPIDANLQALAGLRLTQITFAENLILFVLEDRASITALTSFGYRKAGEGQTSVQHLTSGHTPLVGLIGMQVCEVIINLPREVVLRFDDGSLLDFNDDSNAYESYMISLDGQEMIV